MPCCPLHPRVPCSQPSAPTSTHLHLSSPSPGRATLFCLDPVLHYQEFGTPSIPGTGSIAGTLHPSAPEQHAGRCPARIQGQAQFRLWHQLLVHRYVRIPSTACSHWEDALPAQPGKAGPPELQRPFADPGLMDGAAPHLVISRHPFAKTTVANPVGPALPAPGLGY